MEGDAEHLSARPALENEGLRFLHVTGESPQAVGQRGRAAMFGGWSCVARPWGGLAGSRCRHRTQVWAAGPRPRRGPLGAALPWAALSGHCLRDSSICATQALPGRGYCDRGAVGVCLQAWAAHAPMHPHPHFTATPLCVFRRSQRPLPS